MFLAHARYPKINGLRSGVECIQKQFIDLAFDAEREANYGAGRFLPEELCVKRAKRYEEAFEVCSEYLKDEDIKQFVVGLYSIGLHRYLSQIKKYLTLNHVIDVLDINTILDIFYEDVADSSDEEI